ncbi:MAG: hypothetical protein PHS14_00125 [Elusimicrobia bacterium]|nr:hypothetical protein [Elusimicrobiota bacterium]
MSGVEHKVYAPAPGTVSDDQFLAGRAPETWRILGGAVLIACQHGSVCRLTGHRTPGKDWAIASQGAVSPSVWWRGTCGCHIYVRLEGWPPTA